MLTRRIGDTSVSAVAVGAGGLGGYDKADHSRDGQAVDALRLAFEHGMTLVDTAEVYGQGHSEELVGEALSRHGKPIAVATKVAPEHLHPRDLRPALEGSLRRLRRERVELYQVHWSNPQVPIADTMGALEDLAVEGKIGGIGVCNFSMAELRQAQAALTRTRLVSLQAEYNLFDRSVEREMLPWCRDNGMAFLAYSPLDQGQICGGPTRRAELEAIASRYGCSAGAVALAWLIREPGVIVIPKAAKPEHVMQNALAGRLHLCDDDLATIDALSRTATVEVPVDRIRVVPAEMGDRKVYRTLDEAKRNLHGFAPSPGDLAEQMLSGEFLKPVRVRPRRAGEDTSYDYELIEGRIRYWAWVIAFGGKRDIPVLVRE